MSKWTLVSEDMAIIVIDRRGDGAGAMDGTAKVVLRRVARGYHAIVLTQLGRQQNTIYRGTVTKDAGAALDGLVSRLPFSSTSNSPDLDTPGQPDLAVQIACLVPPPSFASASKPKKAKKAKRGSK